MVYFVDGVVASSVEIILEIDFVCFALQELEIYSFMIQIRILSIILQTFSTTIHSPRHTRVSYVGMILTVGLIVHHGYRLSMSRNRATIKTLCQPRNQNFYEPNLCYNSNSSGFDQPPQYSINHQPQSIQEDLNQQRMNDVLKAVQSLVEKLRQQEQAANLKIISRLPPSIAIMTSFPVLPTMDPEDFLIMGDENLSTIPKRNRTNDDESLPEEDVQEENFKIYSNPLFEFNYEYITSDINPLFDEVLEDTESKDFYVSNLDEPVLLVTPLFDANEDECFDPGGNIDEIDAFLDIDVSTDIEDGYHNSEGDVTYLECLLTNDTTHNLPPEVFLDHDPRSLKDEPDNDDLKSMVKVFDPEIHEKIIYPTYDCPDYEDSRARGFVHRSLELQSFACLYMGIRYARSY
ncbi:hypothetical protein Tco_0088961 [Tanacetum coccineum]